MCQDVFANTDGNEKKTKGWNSSGRDTHVEGWHVGVKDDASVKGDFLKVKNRRVQGSFPLVLKKNLGPVIKRPV